MAQGGTPHNRPAWLVQKVPDQDSLRRMRSLMEGRALNTVCVEAQCPNQGECFSCGTATFLILGDICTRGCRFCAVKGGRPAPADPQEPLRLAQTAAELGLKHVVITSVTRDDLPDQGAGQFAEAVRQVKKLSPNTSVEVLIPDFQGRVDLLDMVAQAGPEVIAHNLETVPRFYGPVRRGAIYQRSLEVVAKVKQVAPKAASKSGIMLGLGETRDEVLGVLADLRGADCDILTLGQYLAPSTAHAPVERFVPPEEFEELKRQALAMGFKYVASSPYVRSSYRADRAWRAVQEAAGA
ncbi:MAG: lipoyl synthase [Deltaproteobacteria bacterium]|nr:lipoyl synthase [Deltaproteobacteria bacterium]